LTSFGLSANPVDNRGERIGEEQGSSASRGLSSTTAATNEQLRPTKARPTDGDSGGVGEGRASLAIEFMSKLNAVCR
jgi:hypothetical protein